VAQLRRKPTNNMEMIIFAVFIFSPQKKSLSIFITIIFPPVASIGYPSPAPIFRTLMKQEKPSQVPQSQCSKRFGKKTLWIERVLPGSPAEKAGL